MINYDIPFTYENSDNPWIMDPKDTSNILELNGQKITAKYLWSLNAEQREKCLYNVFNHYRVYGFPLEILEPDYIINSLSKLRKFKTCNVVNSEGYLSNSGNLCLDVCRFFSGMSFYRAKGNGKTLSMEDVFLDDDLFIKVLKNRMGWNTSKEGGVERPYMFGISDAQIRNGIKNSALGYAVSNFRPTIGKWMYEYAYNLIQGDKPEIPEVFDYSAGWGARALACISLNYKYFGIDPSTNALISNMFNYLRPNIEYNNYKCLGVCSEDEMFQDEEFEKRFDIIGSCPPYYNLEIYDQYSDKQCTRYSYEDWLSKYWEESVKNFSYMIKDNGIFILVMKESNGKYELLKDMSEILNKYDFYEIDSYQYKTLTNHLSGKTKTGRVSKNNEFIKFYGRRN